jgi:hypothetical protein
MSSDSRQRTTSEKISLFRSYFSGLPNVYGTYDPDTGRSWQEKKPVTADTILAHLKGKRHYGVYLLVKDTIRAIAADFDHHDPTKPFEFIQTAKHYRLPAYLEVSKSKGFHVWVFFQENGIKAYKARLVVKAILDQIEASQTEVFPKQDCLDSRASFGNFIYTPLFGRLVPEGRTVFVDPTTLKPYQNQWDFLESINRVEESVLDDIIEINNFSQLEYAENPPNNPIGGRSVCNTALPLCIQKMLQNGVSRFQRSSCFRLAVQLRRIGLPFDATVSVLKTWSLKNKPEDKKRIISDQEIMEQASCAYRKYYQAYGCESAEMEPFCHTECHLFAKQRKRGELC